MIGLYYELVELGKVQQTGENPSPSALDGVLMADDGPNIDRYAVVGHPVAHSRSPMIQQLFAQQTGEHMSYELLDASPEDFEVAVRGFGAAGGKGLNITVPHKQAAFELATELGEAAARSGAVNTLSFRPGGAIRGDNTDGSGFIRDISNDYLIAWLLAGALALLASVAALALPKTQLEALEA